MLLEFKMKNVYSFRDEVTYTMLAPNNKVRFRYQDNYNTICGFDILKTAVIVGENAGGKSNFIKGIQCFKELFKETSDQTKVSLENIFNENLLIDELNDKLMDGNELSQKFEIILTSNNLVYKYKLCISLFGIEHESLYYTDNRNHVYKKVFECNTITDESNRRNYILDIPNNKKIQDLVINNLNSGLTKGLIVNSLSLLGIPNTSEFVNEVLSIIVQKNLLDVPVGIHYKSEDLKPYLSIMKTPEFVEIFKMVDSSIVDIEIDDDFPLLKSLIKRRHSNGYISKRQIAFDSTGVKNFLVMSIFVYKVVYENAIIFNDEMDSTFNPILTSKVISFIHSFETNGQFIFTTHNIFNLTLQTFMKEQMFIVEKNKDTLESKLYSISEFDDLRYDSNEKIYEYYMKGVLGGA